MRYNLGLTLMILAGCKPAPNQVEPENNVAQADFRGGPPLTEWTPEGCRSVTDQVPFLPSRAAFRNLHSDSRGSDEVAIAIGPLLKESWTTESNTFNPTGPVFDREGNLYFSPFNPIEKVALISIDPEGNRRWAISRSDITKSKVFVGSGAPMVMDSPQGEIVYFAVYDRAVAATIDGKILWNMPTGLTVTEEGPGKPVFGVNYHPQTNSIIGLTEDGYVWALDRNTGTSLLERPFQLPGEKSPKGPTSPLPGPVLEFLQDELKVLFDLSDGDVSGAFEAILGNDVEVANFFSVDLNTGTTWISATAPDADDGEEDGVSALGALYALELKKRTNNGGYEFQPRCYASFKGGSASTPALSADGKRAYVADNTGKLLAINGSCEVQWSLDLGEQIVGSVAVSSDNSELYASTGKRIVQIFDRGDTPEIGWDVAPSPFAGRLLPGEETVNLNLTAIAANGLYFQSGVGPRVPTSDGFLPLPRITGVGILDRHSGEVRSFVRGRDETVAVMNTGPDGALYLASSPMRRALYRAFQRTGEYPGFFPSPPLRGGITRYGSRRWDLLVRDIAHAALARTKNALAIATTCPDAAAADLEDVQTLAQQARMAIESARNKGQLSAGLAERLTNRFTQVDPREADLQTLGNLFGALLQEIR